MTSENLLTAMAAVTTFAHGDYEGWRLVFDDPETSLEDLLMAACSVVHTFALVLCDGEHDRVDGFLKGYAMRLAANC